MARLTASRVLWQALVGQRGDVALGCLLVMAHQAAEGAVPVVIGVVVDRAIRTGEVVSMARWVVVLIALFVGLSTAGCLGLYVLERTEVRTAHEVRVAIARRVLHPSGGVDEVALPGELISLATIDATRVGWVTGSAITGAGAVVAILGTAVVLLATSVRLGLVVLLGLPAVLMVVRVLSQPLMRRSGAEQAAVARAAGVATDLMAGLRVLKGLGAERAAAARYRAASRTALAGALRSAQIQGAYEGLTLTLSGVFLVVVAWVGGRLAAQGAITVGEFVAVVGLTQFLVGPLTRLASVGADVARARASAERVAAVLASPAAVSGGKERLVTPVQGRVSLQDVRHGSLCGLDLEIAAGELVGVVTPDPADAGALLACLARTVDPANGKVTLDGMALSALDLDKCRQAVLVAEHDADLFEGTLADNVAVAATGDVTRALAAAAADEVAEALPNGEHTLLTERGRSLSGGQRQRVALARALAADPAVLVLHDPTTAVDAATEHRIAARLRDLRAGKTTIVVTTSPSLLAVADRVVIIHDGKVVAEGTHAGLAAADDRYRAAVLA
jgi:putative ABC transport system ATP-binding protein